MRLRARILLRRLLHAYDNNGLRGLLDRARNRLLPVARLVPGDSASQAGHPDARQHPFDAANHTDTGGHVPGEVLTPGDLYNTAYYGISPSTLRRALALLPFPVPEYTLLDLGCGKGRALLVAAEIPFARVLGVEIAPSLADIARSNTAGRQTASGGPIDVITQSVFDFQYPDGPLVLFLYHPFLAPGFRQVVRSLTRQRAGSCEPVWLLLANFRYFHSARRLGLELVWHHSFALSDEDAAADRHGQTVERYALYRLPNR